MTPPRRDVVHADAFEWLAAHPADPSMSVVTSLPDVSELPELPHAAIEPYVAWFVSAARTILRWIPPGGVAVFYQSDIRHDDAWIDKGYLVMRAAEEERAPIVWHKIVCRKPPGTVTLGRPSYAHMICVARERRPRLRRGADVLPDAGLMSWSRAMGALACKVACRFLREETATETVVDPFCGRGTVLAVANAMGFDAIGVDRGAKRCRAARALVLGEASAASDDADAFVTGARLFDGGAFWEAHEAWEARWRVETDPDQRRVLGGLIQIAAALHQLLVMESAESAMRLFARGLEKLERPATGLDLSDFRQGIERCARALEQGRFAGGQIPRLGKP